MYTIATLSELRQHLGFAATDSAEDARLLAALEAASRTMERATRRHFCPQRRTLAHDVQPLTPNEVFLRTDLLELLSVADAEGSIALEAVEVLRGGILLRGDGLAFRYGDHPENAISITALWGYHPQWADAWESSGDSVQESPLAADDATITVTDAANFQVGHLLRIGDEYIRVLGVDRPANVLTVARGVQGTSAAEHSSGTGIDLYQPPADVKQLCLQWACWLYQEPDRSPNEIPPRLLDALDGLRRISVR